MEEGGLAAGKSTAAACDGWIVFEDEAGQSMTPPRARTWGRIGRTPVVRVRGRGQPGQERAVVACCCAHHHGGGTQDRGAFGPAAGQQTIFIVARAASSDED